MSFVNWLRGVKAKVDIEPVEDGNVILQDNGDGTADLFVDKGNQRLHVIDSTQTSGGHTIWNAIKTALTQRTKLWFADAKVTDDSTEQATKVEVVQLIDDESELTNAPDGLYQGDYEDAPEDILDASMVAYGDGSVKDALFKQFTFNNVTMQNTRDYYDLSISLTADEISRIVFCNATVIASEIEIYQCYWRSTNNGVRVIGKAQTTGTYTIKVTIVFRA